MSSLYIIQRLPPVAAGSHVIPPIRQEYPQWPGRGVETVKNPQNKAGRGNPESVGSDDASAIRN